MRFELHAPRTKRAGSCKAVFSVEVELEIFGDVGSTKPRWDNRPLIGSIKRSTGLPDLLLTGNRSTKCKANKIINVIS